MRHPIALSSPLLAALAIASTADAASTYFASPTGTATADCTTREGACDLASALTLLNPGDTLKLMDGVYKEIPLIPGKSGTSSDWITMQADDCATPILEGPGDDGKTTGGGAPEADKKSYLRFVGIVSRGWNTGFGNHWVDTDAGETPPSNGNIEYKYCIADGNGRTGFTHYSAAGIHIQNCISSHNGSSAAHSWSSGITLYGTSKSTGDAIVEGSISFENMDEQKKTDGSGFIADEAANNAQFLNNIAFGNAGSCLRVTKSSGIKFTNNTCFHNARDSRDQGPSDPGEVYLTDTESRQATFKNNILISTGSGPGAKAVNPGGVSLSGSNNITQDGGSVSLFTSPEGTNPDFTLASSASTAIGKGATGAPASDIGFDPKCIVKKAPTMVGSIAKGSWWQYSVDLDYIKKQGGVAKCFNPKNRSGTPDIGAYASGAVTAAAPATNCPVVAPPGTGGSSGTPATGVAGGKNQGAGGANGGGATGTAAPVKAGGAPGAGGAPAAGGNVNPPKGSGGAVAQSSGKTSGPVSSGAGGSSTVTTNTPNAQGGSTDNNSSVAPTNSGGSNTSNSSGKSSTTSNPPSAGGATGTSKDSTASGNSSTKATSSGDTSPSTTGATAPADSGCGCRVVGQPSRTASLAGLGLLGMVLLRNKRRRKLA